MQRQESNIQLPMFVIDDKGNGKCAVFFNELISTEEREQENTQNTVYIYSTYVLKTNLRANLEADILGNYSDWLNHAKTLDEITASQEVRDKRNKLLVETDYTQVEDASLTAEQKQLYATYRQNLRNIPEQPGFPYEVEWPTQPEG